MKRIFITLSVDEHFVRMLKANVGLSATNRDLRGVDVREALALVVEAEARGGLPEQVHARTPLEWRGHIEPVSDARYVVDENGEKL